MRVRAEVWLLAIVVALAAFIVTQAARAPRRTSAQAAADSAFLDSAAAASENADGGSRVRRSTLPPPGPKDYADIARRITAAEPTTYIDDILAARGGHVARWVDRRDDPIRVWIQPRTTVKDFFPEFRDRARDAFYVWAGAGVPMRFLFVDDSTVAEVRLRWIDHFDDGAAGKTFWSRDQNWWLVDADVQIALHRSSGEKFDALAVRTITMHEAGHVIGLDHSHNADDVMAPRVHATSLTAADLGTASLLYHLPPGSVKATGAAPVSP
ncbi:MAG: matrixin family metalloprotease [Gemmatimonadetes bacterium]|nr:matrixin family metalloprotease [Gemmatimonadota bacterium]MBI3569239.1 matrixin family metalloprotease [Gemmatimonadota bacterium]